jgi:hypothetical protein
MSLPILPMRSARVAIKMAGKVPFPSGETFITFGEYFRMAHKSFFHEPGTHP